MSMLAVSTTESESTLVRLFLQRLAFSPAIPADVAVRAQFAFGAAVDALSSDPDAAGWLTDAQVDAIAARAARDVLEEAMAGAAEVVGAANASEFMP